MLFLYAEQSESFQNILNFQWKFIFLFCELCKRVQNTWATSWPFKKVLYDVALICNYGKSKAIFWWCFCNTWFLYSDKPYCIRRVKRCNYGTNCVWYNKIIVILLYCMSPLRSSVFSICDRSEIDFNCATIAIFFEKVIRTTVQNTQVTNTKTRWCFE